MTEFKYQIVITRNQYWALIDSSKQTNRVSGKKLPQDCIDVFVPLLSEREQNILHLKAYNPIIYPNWGIATRAGVNFLSVKATCNDCQRLAGSKTTNGCYTITAKQSPLHWPDQSEPYVRSEQDAEHLTAEVEHTEHVHKKPMTETKSEKNGKAARSDVGKSSKVFHKDDDDVDQDDQDDSCTQAGTFIDDLRRDPAAKTSSENLDDSTRPTVSTKYNKVKTSGKPERNMKRKAADTSQDEFQDESDDESDGDEVVIEGGDDGDESKEPLQKEERLEAICQIMQQ
jgi:hypothetical protein